MSNKTVKPQNSEATIIFWTERLTIEGAEGMQPNRLTGSHQSTLQPNPTCYWGRRLRHMLVKM